MAKMGWITAERGIRYYEHGSRKVGPRPDRYYTVRFSVDGQRIEEALGWQSEGWTLAKAREVRDELARARRTGEGAVTLKARRAAAQTVRQGGVTVADLWTRYAADLIALRNKPSTAAEKARMWKGRIEPVIGSMAINAVTDKEAGAIVRAPLRLDTDGLIIGGRGEAGNLYRLLHHMFARALAWKMRLRELGNPLEEIDEPKVQRRERLFAPGEITAFHRALDKAEAEQTEHPQVIAVIRLKFAHGDRINELLTLQRPMVRRDEMELHLPDSKSGFSRRPLSTEALAIIDSVDPMPGVPWIFRAIKDPTKPLSYDTVEKAFGRIARAADVPNCSLHTIRHWFTTQTANSVNNPRVGMALTGHKSEAAYMRYVHRDDEQVRALTRQMGALVTRLANAEPNVATLPARAARARSRRP
jgi:site-specific recombinase XerD